MLESTFGRLRKQELVQSIRVRDGALQNIHIPKGRFLSHTTSEYRLFLSLKGQYRLYGQTFNGKLGA